MDKQDKYNDSFALKGKSTTASSYNFESECPIAVNLQKAMTTVDEEGSDFFYGQDLEENYFSLDKKMRKNGHILTFVMGIFMVWQIDWSDFL